VQGPEFEPPVSPKNYKDRKDGRKEGRKEGKKEERQAQKFMVWGQRKIKSCCIHEVHLVSGDFLASFLFHLAPLLPGFDTVTTAVSWSLMYLVTRPEVQRKIHKELGMWCPQLSGQEKAWGPRSFIQPPNTC
jgi:hypothetical protein